MKIQITNGHIPLTKLLKEHIELRVGLTIGRFAERIRLIKVMFLEPTLIGAATGVRCRIEVHMRRRIRVEAVHTDVFAAVDDATANATRRLTSLINREGNTAAHDN
jgi:ribosomal subunit interface protein